MIHVLAPLPSTAAKPLSLMHAACFPDDPWDACSCAQILALHGVFGYLARLDETPVNETLVNETLIDEAPIGGHVAGFVLARDLGGEAEILTLGVMPGVRRRGVGRALLDLLRTEAVRRRIGSIVLEVAADNEAARRLYGAAGFFRAGARPRYYRRGQAGIDALILRLTTERKTISPSRDGAPD